MTAALVVALVLAVALGVYAYAGYAGLLKLVSMRRRRRIAVAPVRAPAEWPAISITIPVYNEAATIGATLERLLAADYPADRRQILVVSDASTDGTDDVVRSFADRGVELLRLPVRKGKTAAENATLPYLRGEIVVNMDATIQIVPDALRPLIAAFADPTVGVASGRDVSVARLGDNGPAHGPSANQGESGYVGYEMWLRQLETNVGGIVGASGCFYAIRADVHRTLLPDALSRDFAAALVARERGLRAVSVPEAVCFVPRTASLRREYQRKVRTMTRGMQTLRHKRALLNPARYGSFAWMLFSHKVSRWLVPWARLLLAVSGLVLAAALLGWAWPGQRTPPPRVLAVPAYLISGNVAALVASLRALKGGAYATWEPTRRDGLAAAVVQRSEASSRPSP